MCCVFTATNTTRMFWQNFIGIRRGFDTFWQSQPFWLLQLWSSRCIGSLSPPPTSQSVPLPFGWVCAAIILLINMQNGAGAKGSCRRIFLLCACVVFRIIIIETFGRFACRCGSRDTNTAIICVCMCFLLGNNIVICV